MSTHGRRWIVTGGLSLVMAVTVSRAAPPAVVPDSVPRAVPEAVRVVLGQDAKKDYVTRAKGVRVMGKNLSEADVRALYEFLDRRAATDNLAPGQLNAIKNDVANVLADQVATPPDFGGHLAAMFGNKEHDIVWRDYCIQHIGRWYSKENEPARREVLRKTLWQAANEKDSSIAGTALIALSNNVDSPSIPRQEVARKALSLCQDPACGELAVITALQICAKFGEVGVLPIARKTAQVAGSAPLRMSAIAAVGALGDPSDVPMLEKHAASSDVRLRNAARAALKRMKAEGRLSR